MAGQKTIVVTGGAGFIGSHLCEQLVKDGHRVISLDNYFAGSKDNHVAGVEYREGHTKDIERLVLEIPDLVYHLGEYARVEQSILEPEVVEDLNVAGTQAVLEFWKQKKFKLVYAGSSTKFGDGGKAREQTPYASTKAANTELVKRVGEKSGLPYAITYFYNVYGPRERAGLYGTVIESFKQMYLSGAPMAVTSPGTQTRNFTHVDDIVRALVLVGEKGEGDEFGLGNERTHTILQVAGMFGGNIVMFPPRVGNRTSSSLDTSKVNELGWKAQMNLEDYVREFVNSHKRGAAKEKRVLTFSTTLYPMGPAEQAFLELAESLPDVQFDLVVARYAAAGQGMKLANVHAHCVGFGIPFDKYLLPILGFLTAMRLSRTHTYLFAWSLMASYGALAATFVRRMRGLPLLVTLADQRFSELPALKRFLLRIALSDADQVYGTHRLQEREVQDAARRSLNRRTLGDGDAFGNQLRYAYATTLVGSSPRI